MPQVLIDWRETHHPKDDRSIIESSIAGGLDEGPLITVPAVAFRGSGRRRLTATIFSDVNEYLAHLACYDGEVGAERFVGLVRRSPNKETAFQALAKIQQTLCPGSDGIVRTRTKGEGRKSLDYCVVPVSYDPSAIEDIEIESMGEGLYDLFHYHPVLKPIVGAEDEDDDEW